MRVWDGNKWRVPISPPRQITQGRHAGAMEVQVHKYNKATGLTPQTKRIIVSPEQIRESS